MNAWLWIGQIVLAVIFGAAGLMKLRSSRAELRARGGWIDDLPDWMPKFIGVAEILGAIGVIVPPLFDMDAAIVPIAAGSLAVVMVLAAFVHLLRREFVPYVIVNAVIFAVAAFVTWGRIEDTPL